MMVANYLETGGIHPNGDRSEYAARNYLYLSVSATPFSEFTDNLTYNQGKMVIVLEPGEGHIGPKQFLSNGNIHGFDDPLEGVGCIIDCLRRNPDPCITIARIQGKEDTEAKGMFERAGYDVVRYNGDSEPTETIEKYLSVQPTRHLLILIKGRLRMGKNIEKTWIAHCLESSKDINTDTMLQSLIGRCSGYDSHLGIQFYVSNKFLESGEIQKYIAMFEGDPVVPSLGNNMVPSKSSVPKPSASGLFPIIPLHLPAASFVVRDNDGVRVARPSDRMIRDEVYNMLKDNQRFDRFESMNTSQQNAAIKEFIQDRPYANFHLRRLGISTRQSTFGDPTYPDARMKIAKAINERTAIALGSSGGVREDDVIIWYVDLEDVAAGLLKGHVYVSCKTKEAPPTSTVLPQTTGREIFGPSRLE